MTVDPAFQCECGSGEYWSDCHPDYEAALKASGELDYEGPGDDDQDPELYK